MRLVACSQCHTQFDVSGLAQSALRCHCGMLILVGAQQGRTVAIARCGECGAPWTEGASRCEYCGGALDTSQDLPLICPECYAQNPEASRHCRGCGVAFRPEPLRREATETLCPGCNRDGLPTLLVRRELRGLWISECPECHGTWVGRRNFEQLINRTAESQAKLPESAVKPQPVDPEARVRYARCPECDAQMQRRNFQAVSGVIIDRCASHGVWMDANELEAIARFVGSGGLARARAHELEELRETFTATRESRIQPHVERELEIMRSSWLGSLLGLS